MNIIATLIGCLIVAAAAFGQTSAPPLACIRDAIRAEERPRYNQLVAKLRSAARERGELDDGYAIRIHEGLMTLAEAAEWIGFERKCCPFLTLAIRVEGTERLVLMLTGPAGTKQFLDAELRIAVK